MSLWFKSPPVGRKYALIWTGIDYQIAQWEPKNKVWVYYYKDGNIVELKQALWHPLPDVYGVDLDNRIYELESKY